jgi:hypothetical protein
MALLTALASGFGRTLPVMAEVARTPLPAQAASPGRLRAILGEIPWIAGMWLF